MQLPKLAERLADFVRRWLATIRGWRSRLAVFGVRRAGVEAPSDVTAETRSGRAPVPGVPANDAPSVWPEALQDHRQPRFDLDFGPEFDWADPDFCSELYGPAPYGAAFASSLGGHELGEEAQAVPSKKPWGYWALRHLAIHGADAGDADSDLDPGLPPGSDVPLEGLSPWWSGPWWQEGLPCEPPLDADVWSEEDSWSPEDQVTNELDWDEPPEDVEESDLEFEFEFEGPGDLLDESDGGDQAFESLADSVHGNAFGLPSELSETGDTNDLDDEGAPDFDGPGFDPGCGEDSWQSDMTSSPEDIESPLAGFYSELSRAGSSEDRDPQLGDAQFGADYSDLGEPGEWFGAQSPDALGDSEHDRASRHHDDFVDSDERARFAGQPPILPSDLVELDWSALEARLRGDRPSS